MRTLGVDRPIDYTQENVWDLPEFQSAQGQFDLVFDLAAGGWENGVKSDVGRANPIIKSGWQGGRFVATVGRTKWFDAHSWFDIAKVFVFPTITKMASTWLMRWSQPRFVRAGGAHARMHPRHVSHEFCCPSLDGSPWGYFPVLLPIGFIFFN